METSWDESRIGPDSSGLKEAAARRESGGRGQEREGELERGDSHVYILFLSDFDSKAPWPSLTSALIILGMM